MSTSTATPNRSRRQDATETKLAVASVGWSRFMAYVRNLNFKAVAFNCVVLPVLGMIVWVVNSQGLRMSLPIFGLKLHRLPVPGLSMLRHYRNVNEFDLAHVFSLIVLGGVYVLGMAVLRMYLFGVEDDDRLAKRRQWFLTGVATITILADLAIFFQGIRDQTGSLFDHGTGGLTPIIATIGYTGLLAGVAYVHVLLQTQHREKEKS